MNTVAKIFVVLNLAFALIYVGVAATLLQKQEHWKKQFYTEEKTHKADNDKNTNEIAKLNDMVNTKTTEIADWRARLDQANQALTAQQNENKGLEKKWTSLEGNYQALEEKYRQLADNLSQVQAQKDELHKTLQQKNADLDDALRIKDQAVDDFQRVQKELEDSKVDLGNLRERIVEIAKQKTELEWVIARVQEQYQVTFEGIWPPIPKIDGRVVGVSSKVNLVVISVGESEGVRVGFEFTIYRGTTYVGKMVIEHVYQNQAAGRVVLDKTKDKVQPGDNVTTQLH